MNKFNTYSQRNKSTVDRFWEKVDIAGENDCWLWRSGRFDYGYGMFWVNGANVGAHAYSWRLANGDIPDGLNVCHSCDVPECVNPNHLYLGTDKDNAADRERKERGRKFNKQLLVRLPNGTHVPKGRFTKDQLLQKEIDNMPKKILIAMPPAMLEQVDHIAMVEHRTRSDLIREALRRYLQQFEKDQKQTNFAPPPANPLTVVQ